MRDTWLFERSRCSRHGMSAKSSAGNFARTLHWRSSRFKQDHTTASIGNERSRFIDNTHDWSDSSCHAKRGMEVRLRDARFSSRVFPFQLTALVHVTQSVHRRPDRSPESLAGLSSGAHREHARFPH